MITADQIIQILSNAAKKYLLWPLRYKTMDFQFLVSSHLYSITSRFVILPVSDSIFVVYSAL